MYYSNEYFGFLKGMSSSPNRDSFEVQFSVPAPQTLKSPAVKDGRRPTRGLSRVLWCHVLMWRRRWWIFSSDSQTAECACVKQRRNLPRCCACSPKLWQRPLSSKRFSLHCIDLCQNQIRTRIDKCPTRVQTIDYPLSSQAQSHR